MIMILFKSLIFNLLELCIHTYYKLNKLEIEWGWINYSAQRDSPFPQY